MATLPPTGTACKRSPKSPIGDRPGAGLPDPSAFADTPLFQRYYTELRKYDAADAAVFRAQVHGDRRQVEAAGWTLLEAQQDLDITHDAIASDLLFAVRLAIWLRPAGLDDLIRQVPIVRDLEDRVTELEKAVIVLASRKGGRAR